MPPLDRAEREVVVAVDEPGLDVEDAAHDGVRRCARSASRRRISRSNTTTPHPVTELVGDERDRRDRVDRGVERGSCCADRRGHEPADVEDADDVAVLLDAVLVAHRPARRGRREPVDLPDVVVGEVVAHRLELGAEARAGRACRWPGSRKRPRRSAITSRRAAGTSGYTSTGAGSPRRGTSTSPGPSGPVRRAAARAGRDGRAGDATSSASSPAVPVGGAMAMSGGCACRIRTRARARHRVGVDGHARRDAARDSARGTRASTRSGRRATSDVVADRDRRARRRARS